MYPIVRFTNQYGATILEKGRTASREFALHFVDGSAGSGVRELSAIGLREIVDRSTAHFQ